MNIKHQICRFVQSTLNNKCVIYKGKFLEFMDIETTADFKYHAR